MTLIAATSLFLLTGCETLNVQSMIGHTSDLARSFTQTITPEQERAMGDESAALLLGSAPLVKNAPMQRYVNQVGQWIALQAGAPDIAWRFGVLDTESINAFAAPAGYVFITKGLMRRLDNEAELAGVLAHEIGHVTQRHHANNMIKRDRAAVLSAVAGSALQTAGKGDMSSVLNVSRGLYGSGLDKADEYQADRIAVTLATRAGYEPFGLARVLQMYAANAGQSGFELLFSTHPSPGDRLQRLASAMGDRYDAFEADGIKNTRAFPQHVKALGRVRG
jgi:predicted Zn-dependent protease